MISPERCSHGGKEDQGPCSNSKVGGECRCCSHCRTRCSAKDLTEFKAWADECKSGIMGKPECWLAERLPKIQDELKEHGFVAVEEKFMDTVRGLSTCLFWIAMLAAGPLIGAGVHDNKLAGAGVGVATAALAMFTVQSYYNRKRKREGKA